MEVVVFHIGAKGVQRHPFVVHNAANAVLGTGFQNNGGEGTAYARAPGR